MFKKIMIVATLGVVLFVSCKKESDFGSQLIGDENFPNSIFSDTFQVFLNTKYSDTVSTDKLTYAMLGVNNDAVYGLNYSTFYAQLRLPNNNIDLASPGTGFVIDSAVIQLPYKFQTDKNIIRYYGDTTKTIQLQAFQMNEKLVENSNYQSGVRFNVGQLLGEASIIGSSKKIAVNNHVDINKFDTLPAHIRIKITNNNFIQTLQNQTSSTGFASTESFNDLVNGLAIMPSDTNRNDVGCIYTIDYTNSNSGLIVYYHKVGVSSQVNGKLRIELNTNSLSAAHYSNNYTNTLVNQFVNNNSSNDTLSFIQGLNGVNTIIKFPTIRNLGTNAIINKAELKLYPTTLSGTANYALPDLIGIVLKDSSGKMTVIPDFSNIDVYNNGGEPQTETVNGISVKVYKISLTMYLQKILLNQESGDNIYLVIAGKSTNPANMTIKGGNAGELKAKLRLFYTPI
jgi:hypothetical protein